MPDVDIRRGNEPQRFGLTATAIPEANGSQTGVSVENAQSETKQWYVLRVSYGRAEKANELLKAKGIETHLPLVHGGRAVCHCLHRENVAFPLGPVWPLQLGRTARA